MTTPLSQEQRAELVAKAKAATPGPWRIVPYDCGDIDYLDNAPMVAAAPELDCAIVHWEGFVQRYWRSARGEKEIQANAAFIAAANPSTILSYEATVVALTVERDAALERVKALKAGAKPFIDAALQIPAEVEDFKVIAHVPGGPNAKAYLRVSELLTAGAFRQARAALHPEPLGEGGGL